MLDSTADVQVFLVGDLSRFSRHTVTALRQLIPPADESVDGVQVTLLSERLDSEPIAYGGGARRAESLLSLTLEYELHRTAGDQERLRRQCRRSVNHLEDDIRSLATVRRRDSLVAGMASACARQMLDLATALAVETAQEAQP